MYLTLLWTSQKTNTPLTCGLNMHCLKVPHLKKHADFSAPHRIQARLHMRITLHVFSNRTLITRYKTRRRLSLTHTYKRVTLLHPQGMIHFSQHFLHTISQFHYWLKRWSANISACTFHSTTKTCHHRTKTCSTTVASHPSSDISHTNIQTPSLYKVYICIKCTTN